ncbi:hypothetical protein [Acetobacter sp. UBA5411]|uniref:hypothetical protein n=1 Tax=Acetobacter sp. UBA5411 TaxID=1945905 RepID=UPI0025C1C6C5|nr:hypothetical protein [Acetobacter sp. UBA5411]
MSLQAYEDEQNKKLAFKGIVDNILYQYGLGITVDINNIHAMSTFFIELSYVNDLSNAIFEYMFQKETAFITVDHYTSPEGFRGILSSEELRLHSVTKRLGQGELDEFAKFHNLNGYLSPSTNGKVYAELADDLFYTSFTTSLNKDKPYLWRCFAKQGTGVRLTFEVKGGRADLRHINYNNKNTTILKEINYALTDAGLPPFTPWGISRLGAFYLPPTLQNEEEVRLLLKRWDASAPSGVVGSSPNSYWPIPIDVSNNCADIKLVAITFGPKADVADFTSLVSNSKFANVSCATAKSDSD